MNLLKKKDTTKTEQEKVEERREEVLSTGRKFKYPSQWTKHRIVISTILISLVMIAMVIVGGWLALYKIGMTDDLLFRVTKILPVPVANVDSENALFSDYIMLYKSSMTSIERQSGSQFDDNSINELRLKYKRTALTDTESYTYAIKLAKEQGIEVTKEDVAKEFDIVPCVAALNGGEDYELLFTVKQEDYEKVQNMEDVRIIGFMTPDVNVAELITNDEHVIPIEAQGFKHF